MFWELELSYFLSQIIAVVTITEVTIAPCLKVTGTVTKFLFKSNFPIPVDNNMKKGETLGKPSKPKRAKI